MRSTDQAAGQTQHNFLAHKPQLALGNSIWFGEGDREERKNSGISVSRSITPTQYARDAQFGAFFSTELLQHGLCARYVRIPAVES